MISKKAKNGLFNILWIKVFLKFLENLPKPPMVICDLNIQKHLLVIFKFLKKTSKNRNNSFWNLKIYQNKVFQNEVGPPPLDSIFHSLSIKHVFTHILYSKLWRKHPKIDTAVFGNLKVFKENNFRKMGDHHP